jgi:hypothetical protein
VKSLDFSRKNPNKAGQSSEFKQLELYSTIAPPRKVLNNKFRDDGGGSGIILQST